MTRIAARVGRGGSLRTCTHRRTRSPAVPRDPFNVPDAEFRAKMLNYSTLIGATPAAFGVSPEQGLTLSGNFAAFDAAYQAAVDPITRTKGKIAMKNTKRQILRDYARML